MTLKNKKFIYKPREKHSDKKKDERLLINFKVINTDILKFFSTSLPETQHEHIFPLGSLITQFFTSYDQRVEDRHQCVE